MPIAPKPFKYACLKCGYSKVIKPKSDALSPVEMINICPKCNASMQHKELNALDNIKVFLHEFIKPLVN